MTTESETKKGGANGTPPRTVTIVEAKFDPGAIYITPHAEDALTPKDVLCALARHVRGDWGNVCPQDRRENELALREGYRLFSVYRSSDSVKFWIITEADRSVTTVLLPDDY